MSLKIANKQVGPIGFGLMGFTARGEKIIPYDEACEVMKRALELGANFWNGGEFYGPPHANSLHLLVHYFNKYPEDREKVVISIKGGIELVGGVLAPNGSPDGIRKSIDNCLQLLQGKVFIDIFEPARVDPEVPIETTVATIAEYVKAGKIGGIGLSECSGNTARRAHAVHPIAAVESELSLFATEPLTDGLADTCAELNIPIVGYSPLARGWLTGQLRSLDDIPEHDIRRRFPRFQPEVFHLNLKLADAVEEIARRKNIMPAQIAIAWVQAQNKAPGRPPVIPLPGCTTLARLEENMAQVSLNEKDLEEIDQVVKEIPVHGLRYPPAQNKFTNL